MRTMQIRDAKAGLSALVDAAEKGEATTITRHGKPAAVIVSIEDAKKIFPETKPNLGKHLLAFPGGIEFERNMSPMRKFDF